jgi:hypothetical protein
MNNKHTLSFGLRVCITYRAASLARTNLLLSATSDGLFMDELESITMTTSLYLGDAVAANFDLWKINVSIITFKYIINCRVPLVKQELITLPEHLSSPLDFSGVRVTRSLVLCVCFIDRCLSFCTFSFGHCIVCSSSIYGLWLPHWYLQSRLDLWRVCRYQRGNQNPHIFVDSHFRGLRLNLICKFVDHLLWSVHVYDDK